MHGPWRGRTKVREQTKATCGELLPALQQLVLETQDLSRFLPRQIAMCVWATGQAHTVLDVTPGSAAFVDALLQRLTGDGYGMLLDLATPADVAQLASGVVRMGAADKYEELMVSALV